MAARTAVARPDEGSPLTVQEWKQMANRIGARRSWNAAARRFAGVMSCARAVVLLADDTLVVMTHSAGKVSRRTHKPGTWCWA